MNIAEEIMKLDPNIRGGSLRMFGCWFGRPMDNIHQSKTAVYDGQVLKIYFNEGEVLEIWNPSGIIVEGTILRIPKASKVKWYWYYYGKPRQEENLLYYEYIVEGNNVTSSTNSPWRNHPAINEPAVELC